MHGGYWAALATGFALHVAVVAIAGSAGAVDWERLVMPGQLVESHADLEADCSNCHQPFQREAESQSCATCHDDVADDIANTTGFHGRSGVDSNGCRVCHPDHQGRDADIVGLDEQNFVHSLTDFPLEGRHEAASCAGCHTPGTRHRDASGDCASCHAKDDPHAGSLGEDCGDCHSDIGWSRAKFDHDATSFKLVGGHREVQCGQCHPDEFYEGTPDDCSSCHTANDVHGGFYGSDCGTCHSPRKWREVRFRHERDAGFALDGAHGDAACRSCHSAPLFDESPLTECASCHAREDIHRGRNGQDCGRCHDSVSWKQTTFDHEKTGFPLRGNHERALCSDCHSSDPFGDELDTTCESCHRDADVHAGQVGTRCGDCHKETSWQQPIFFEHDITRFPLLGMHAVAACDSCHVTLRFHDATTSCQDCHEDTRHRGRLGSDCGSCHNPNAWGLWDFDHSQTGFDLVGAHQDVNCHDCHRTAAASDPLSATCSSCHSDDDDHDGAFGSDCDRCHNQTNWESVDVMR
jgi:hypothetical protein